MKDHKPLIVLGAPASGHSRALPQLAVGMHVGRILAIDMAKAEDSMSALLAKISVNGTVLIEQIWQLDNLVKPIKLRAHSYADMFEMPYVLPRKGDRHHKRKPQPNRGPQGRNQWS